MDSNKNNSSHNDHISPPLAGGQTNLLGPGSHRHTIEMIRRIVREEHCKMSHYNLPPPRLLSDSKIPAQYQLQFMNKVKNPTFTTDLVRDEKEHPIKVAMYDTYTKPKSIISGDNILSSAKVRLILLDAEFCTNRVNCSSIELVQNVLRGRERKGPILTGRSLIIQLENGVGTFENIVFTDNSSWTKIGFRLGGMVVCDGEEGYLNGERVQEAVGESFRVLDRRGKWSQKPDRLKLKDNVLCIKKIGKGRASDLEKMNITIVWDFLKLFYSDEPALRKILCIKSKSSRDWETMVEHVMQCADEYHAECIASNNSSQPQQVLVDPVERDMSLSSNVGHPVVGSGSLDPNPSENDLIKGDVPGYCKPQMNFPNECGTPLPMLHMEFDLVQHTSEYYAKCIASNNNSQPQQDLVDPMKRNVPLGTNVGHGVVGSESSEPNPSKNNITEGAVPATNKPYVPAYFNPTMSFSYELEMQTPVSNDGGFPQFEFPFDPTSGNDSLWGPHAASAHFGGSGGGSDGGRFPQPELSFDGGNYDSNGGGGPEGISLESQTAG